MGYLDRYNFDDAAVEEFEATPLTLRYQQGLDDGALALAQRAERLQIPAYMKQPSDVHVQIMGVIDDMFTMALTMGGGKLAPPLMMLVRSIRRFEPVLLEHLANVPDEDIISAMKLLGERITFMAESMENGSNGPKLVAAPRPPVAPGA